MLLLTPNHLPSSPGFFDGRHILYLEFQSIYENLVNIFLYVLQYDRHPKYFQNQTKDLGKNIYYRKP